jgi:N-acetylmuramoyl-L-alanine amidase
MLTQPRRLIVNVLSMATDVVSDPLESLEDPEIEEEPLLPVVTIDAGHGGEDRGITSGTLLEKDVVRQISMLLRSSLQKIKLEADTTRSSDFNPSLSLRSSVANTNQSIVFVSLHLGGSHTPDVRGPIVYTHDAGETEPPRRRPRSEELTPWYAAQQPHLKQSRRLAQLIQERLNTLFGTSNSAESAPLEVLAPVQAPSVLIEAGFLTNPEDARRLEDPAFQESIAKSIADAIRVFLR